MSKRLLALLACLSLVLAACPANYKIDNIAAGTVVFDADSVSFALGQNSSLTTRTYDYVFTNQFAAAPSVALGNVSTYSALQDFAVNYLNANAFSVVPASIRQTDVVFQFDFTASVWASIKVNFWASTNNQIQIGTFKLGTLHLM